MQTVFWIESVFCLECLESEIEVVSQVCDACTLQRVCAKIEMFEGAWFGGSNVECHDLFGVGDQESSL